ncbi:hypothetical protein B0T19DRAFT_439844 [Cercophora scortea]|uniref:Uncharacterized protein n=1 Tax=Cercophora scortea TaxID=314031 RepID=A0AAE0IY29_9PEZI|nr:hypothetical protein B0T19DRAFT_439844 [Cercophora scortea]
MASTARAAESREVAEFYHGSCIRLLIGLEDGDELVEGGAAPQTACLLRSYEILDTAQDVDMSPTAASGGIVVLA